MLISSKLSSSGKYSQPKPRGLASGGVQGNVRGAKAARKHDALALAELIYDVYKEQENSHGNQPPSKAKHD